jgi:hemoglobin
MTTTTCADIASADTGPADEAVSIYAAIGGRPALKAAVSRFFVRLLADPVLGPIFHRGVGEPHQNYVVTLLGEALGGPERYHGPDLTAAHRALGITGAQFDLTAAHLHATLRDLGIPAHLTEQIVAIVAGLRPAIVTA